MVIKEYGFLGPPLIRIRYEENRIWEIGHDTTEIPTTYGMLPLDVPALVVSLLQTQILTFPVLASRPLMTSLLVLAMPEAAAWTLVRLHRRAGTSMPGTADLIAVALLLETATLTALNLSTRVVALSLIAPDPGLTS